MPLLQNKFQPYFPDTESPNNYQCGSEKYCNPITVGDTVYAQFYQTPCEDNEVTDPGFTDISVGIRLETDGNFNTDPFGIWTYGAAWTWDSINTEMDAVAATGDNLAQSGLALIYGRLYRITFDIVRTGGSVEVILGYGDPGQTQTESINTTGSYSFDLPYTASIGFENITFYTDNFTGTITNVTVRELTYTYWNTNDSWYINNGRACHMVGFTNDLVQSSLLTVANSYIYRFKFTINYRTAGTCEVKLADVSSGVISTNGTFTFWDIPTIAGDLKIEASPDFDGCISNIEVYKLGIAGTAITAKAINEIGTEYDISASLSNYEDYVTMAFNFEDYELADGCYNIEVTMPCGLDDYTYTSECIQYNSNGFARTKMVVGWCDQPSFGFEFDNTGFKLQQRVELRSIAPTYPKQTSIMKTGSGDARLVYSEIEKYWQLHTTFASETFHDAMAAIISCDHFQIGDTQSNGIEYVAEAEDYSPNWQTDGSYSLATAVINVRVKEKGQVFNRHI